MNLMEYNIYSNKQREQQRMIVTLYTIYIYIYIYIYITWLGSHKYSTYLNAFIYRKVILSDVIFML